MRPSTPSRAKVEEDPPLAAPGGGTAPLVLLIDDAPEIVEVLVEMLRTVGYEVETANDGFEGLAAMRTRRPDVVLLDHNMPRMPGLEVVRAMRDDAALATIPVILITASPKSVPADPAPMVRVLPKPFDFDRLFEILQQTVAATAEPASS
jgi:chemosensory pili system protein ChpA (sensor histidine kinase/response regulator)